MANFERHHDRLRTFLLHEPRGHAAMVGVVMTESRKADFGAFFLGSYKYLEMCGHASIGLAVTLDHMGLISPGPDGKALATVEVPAGVIALEIDYSGGRPDRVTLRNVPAFVAGQGSIILNGSEVDFDIVYGGNWYGLVEAQVVGVDLVPSGVGNAMTVGAAIKRAVNAAISNGDVAGVSRPIDSVLFHQTGREDGCLVTRQLVVLESNKFDRSPCGTGTSARLAQLIAGGEVAPGETILSRNILDIDFEAVGSPDPQSDGKILPSISGTAFITGYNSFLLQDGDPLDQGFLCR